MDLEHTQNRFRNPVERLANLVAFPYRAVIQNPNKSSDHFMCLRDERMYYVAKHCRGRVLDVGCGPGNMFLRKFYDTLDTLDVLNTFVRDKVRSATFFSCIVRRRGKCLDARFHDVLLFGCVLVFFLQVRERSISSCELLCIVKFVRELANGYRVKVFKKIIIHITKLL